jgi:hypothetical protein
MSVHIVMDLTGDTRHEFDALDQEAVALAEERFKELTGSGFTAAERTKNETKVTRKFNPTAEETIFIPRLQGG